MHCRESGQERLRKRGDRAMSEDAGACILEKSEFWLKTKGEPMKDLGE